jgi:hypothetical protein
MQLAQCFVVGPLDRGGINRSWRSVAPRDGSRTRSARLDKRALLALRSIEGFPAALSGRIVVLEAILIALCDRLGVEELRRRLQPMMSADQMVQVCFSAENPDPKVALLSYYEHVSADVVPLVLWHPGAETVV